MAQVTSVNQNEILKPRDTQKNASSHLKNSVSTYSVIVDWISV